MGLEGTKYSIQTTAELEIIECYKCAMPFAVPVRFKKNLQKNQDAFYCPQGHSQSYEESSETILKRDYEKRLTDLKNTNNELHRDLIKLRITPGCPHCGKKVKHVDMHIKHSHPETYLKSRKN